MLSLTPLTNIIYLWTLKCVHSVIKKTKIMKVNVAQRRFYIWKLELWWIAFDKEEFYPEGRKQLVGNWFWRT
jgi:hypothetical protein